MSSVDAIDMTKASGPIPWRMILRLLAGLVFLASGIAKAPDTTRFLFDLQAFELFPYPLAWFLAHYVPWLELLIGAGLVLGMASRGAALLGLLSAIAFIAALLLAPASVDFGCGCFGSWFSFPTRKLHLAFNALLGTFCLLVVLLRPRSTSTG